MEDIDRLKNDNRFLHFDSEYECDHFIQYANKRNIKIGHRCCSNKGCYIIDQFIDIYDLKNNFEYTLCKKTKEKECPICFEIKTYNIKCKQCNNLLCKDCSIQINKCPFCRKNL